MSKLTLQLLDETFSIHSFSEKQSIPSIVFSASVYFIGKTRDELSIVVPENIELQSIDKDSGWKALEVIGPLSFSLTGILADLATVLAKQKISIFAISTFDTDYVLIKKNTVNDAINALKLNDYRILGFE